MARVLFFALIVAGCDPTSEPRREWTPADHEVSLTGQAAPNQVEASPDKATDPQELVELAWQRNCFTCHGPTGRGDGPQGPMVRAPDLTRQAFLEEATDAEIAAVIREGRGSMPAFKQLPAPIIDGLVARIRGGGAPSTKPPRSPEP